MAAILGIVAGLLGPAIELGKCFADPIKHQFNYLCYFNSNVRTLENEAKKLEGKRVDLQSRVDTDERNALVIDSQVLTWMDEVSEIQEKMHEIESEINATRNGDYTVRSRFSLSKKVKKIAEAMKELRLSGNFNSISQPPPPASSVSIPLRSSFEFESRKQIEEEIMVNLKDNKTKVLGICGMGGVGKTTMAKSIMDRVRKELGFEETVMTVVSQQVDMLRIQDDIAKSLGLKLEKEGTLSSRAHILHTRLTACKNKSLIVLDDIWEHVKFEELGIPCNGDGGCKILLTSRNRDVFKRMHVEKVHAVVVLSDTEAWDLFKSNVGSCIERENVVSIAHKVVRECKGLPIALVTVGAALKETEITSIWEGWLQQLKSSNPTDLPNVLDDVYKPLRLSYELLENERAKSLFLLCCLFPEDHNIPLESLTVYATGLSMFEDIPNLEETKSRVFLLVEMLKSRFLLLEGYNKNRVKMHDVVRDVAIYIASDEKRINCNDCTWLSPHTRERTRGSTVFPNLHLLLIDKELKIGNHFFEGMRKLSVVSVECWSLRHLPKSVELLKNLRTLILVSCRSMKNISLISELVNLEILICRDCDAIECLPAEMWNLTSLRLLELSRCWNLKTIPPGIISNLKELEELIVECYGNWEAEITGIQGKNASLSELQHLPRLTRLKIRINDSRLAGEHIRFLPLVNCDITIGYENIMDLFYFGEQKFEKKIGLKLAGNMSLGNWIHECVRRVECMCVEGDGSRNLDFGVAHNMRSLTLSKCSTVKKLVNMRTSSANAHVFPLLETLKLEEVHELEEICDVDGPYHHKTVSIFNKLSSVHIYRCDRLQSLFTVSMVGRGSCLAHLKRLEIEHCNMMEQVFLWNEKERPLLVFPKLKFLTLYSLPMLTSFCKGIECIEFPMLAEVIIKKCPLLKSFGLPDDHDEADDDSLHFFCKPHMVKFGCLSKLNVSMERNLCPQIPVIHFFAGLCELSVSNVRGKSLFSKTEIGGLLQLEKLEIRLCDMMEQVILCDEEKHSNNSKTTVVLAIAFPKLKSMRLRHLPRLTSLSKGIEFLLPAQMDIWNCPLMETSSSSLTDASLHLFCQPRKDGYGSLEELSIGGHDCVRNWCVQIPMDLFARLCKLRISEINGMESLFPCSIARNLVNVRELYIHECEDMVRVIEDEEEEEDDDDDEEEEEEEEYYPLFPNLEFLDLSNQQKLKSFCEWRRPLQLPSLRRLKINSCDVMKKFTYGPLNTPKLDDIIIDNLTAESDLSCKDVNNVLQKHMLDASRRTRLLQ